MRVARFRERGDPSSPARLGAILRQPAGELLLALDAIGLHGAAGEAAEDGDLTGLLAADPSLAATTEAVDLAVRAGARTIERRTTRTLAPLRPGKIVGIGLNYRDHVEEQHIPIPDRPILFAKFANAVIGDGEPIVRHGLTRALDLESELAVVIGRPVSRAGEKAARSAVAGYLAANDVTARDLQGIRAALAEGQRGDGQWLRAKGSDGFCPLGPLFVTADELTDPNGLAVRSWRTVGGSDGRPQILAMQDGTTSDMIFGVERLVSFVSEAITLEAGDVILTGTPAGAGAFREPPVFLEPGDVATVEVEGIGRLSNPIVDAEGRAPEGSPAARVLEGLHAGGGR